MTAAEGARSVGCVLPSPYIHRLLVDARAADLRREASHPRHRRSRREKRS
jgi:hypothetical protein